ncbi:MAG: proprotein convertase P-domain-containing protein [Piscinibacter sp.]|uniref:proprotein convertase P-domain-containing protein n=1 Tax=Piscinibacter sp. TaxID=1903157 RepID=UPI0025897BEE|nr:proprotein convertase P-domain-containing protein [Piscinibacter sp.]MCW5666545.1 proprotein convertase P-domain-containing protein [Piscinibacter sp.]
MNRSISLRSLCSLGLAVLVAMALGSPPRSLAHERDRDDLRDARPAPGRLFSGRGAGGVIPDGIGTNMSGAPLRSTIVVPRHFSGPVTTVWVEFDGLAHTWPGDLRARLIHPDGTTAMDLFSRPGRGAGEFTISSTFGFGADFVATNKYTFADNGTILFLPHPLAGPPGGWQEGPSIPSGTFRPTSNPNAPDANALDYMYTPASFARTFGGKRADGAWTLEITEWAGDETGSLRGWTLNICSGTCPAARPAAGDELLRLTAFSPGLGWSFGESIAVDRSTLVVGSPSYGGGGGFSAGAAYLFDATTGRQTALLPPTNDAAGFARFGHAVAIDRHTVLVGAPRDRIDVIGAGWPTGSVTVYDVRDRDRPVERMKLLPGDADGSVAWEFGTSVAVRGKLAAVGAYVGNGLHANGKVYLFDLATGDQLAAFTASDTVTGDAFGRQLAISGNTLLVSAPVKDGDTGAVYVFDVSNPHHPVQRHKLTAADAGDGRFGHALAIDGDRILVGAPWVRSGEAFMGAAYLFDAGSGRRLARLTASTPPTRSFNFGWSVALRNRTAVVGVPFSDGPFGLSSGSAYVFDIGEPRRPVEVLTLAASDAEDSDWFGLAAAMDGDRIFVGATQIFTSAGKVTVFQAPGRP